MRRGCDGEVARRMRIPVLCDSDAHAREHVGRYYNPLAAAPHGDPELFAMLRRGLFTAVMREADGSIKEIVQCGESGECHPSLSRRP